LNKRGYSGIEFKLVTQDTGEEVDLPLTRKDFRGEDFTITGATPPHKPSSTGRIYLSDGSSFYPSVCGLEWKKLTS